MYDNAQESFLLAESPESISGEESLSDEAGAENKKQEESEGEPLTKSEPVEPIYISLIRILHIHSDNSLNI